MKYHYIFVFALLFGCSITKQKKSRGSHMSMQKCEPITIRMCMNLPYNETIYPNLMNHDSQEEAALELHQFSPLIEMKCSFDLALFLCTMHTPVCTALDKYLPPCKSLCESARMGCEKIMQQHGFPWPKRMNCSNFPEFDGSGSCIVGKTYGISTTTTPDVEEISTHPSLKNHSQISPSQGFEKMVNATTSLPATPSPALPEVWAREQFEAMPDHDLLVFNSMTMLQLLQDNAKLREEVLILQKNFEQLSSAICDNKTSSGNGNTKEMEQLSAKSIKDQQQLDGVNSAQTSHGKCEPITIKLCMNMPYNETMMPNLLSIRRQDDIGVELRQFSALVKLKCSPDLEFFLCALYLPQCTPFARPIPPCRSLCESAKMGCERVLSSFGYAWPRNMNCSKFPEFDGNGLCVRKN